MSVEKTAAYYILGSGALGILALLLLVIFRSPNATLFIFASAGAVALGYYYWNYWQ